MNEIDCIDPMGRMDELKLRRVEDDEFLEIVLNCRALLVTLSRSPANALVGTRVAGAASVGTASLEISSSVMSPGHISS